MKVSGKSGRAVIAAIVLAAVMLAMCAFATAGSAKKNSADLWLSHFVGGPVAVTFISAPPDMERIVKARLVEAETAGIVLRIPRKRERFFSYANIISVEPK